MRRVSILTVISILVMKPHRPNKRRKVAAKRPPVRRTEFSSPEENPDTPLMERLLKPEGCVNPNEVTPNRTTHRGDYIKIFSSSSDKRKEAANIAEGKNPYSTFVNDSEEHYLPERRSPTPSPVGQRHEDKLLVEEICDEEAFLVKEEQKLPVVKLEERDSESD